MGSIRGMDGSGMRIISVAAVASGSGKTSLVCALCAAFPGRFTAVKFTTLRPGEPVASRIPEASNVSPPDGFSILSDPQVVERSGSDTARIAAAGAATTHWCIAYPDGYPRLWSALRDEVLSEAALLVTEGNTAAGIACPDLLIFVYNPFTPPDRWKDSAWRLLGGADVIVTNPYHPDKGYQVAGMPKNVLDKAGRVRPDALRVIGDPSLPLQEWEGRNLLERLQRLVG
jgi:hypothetical protein